MFHFVLGWHLGLVFGNDQLGALFVQVHCLDCFRALQFLGSYFTYLFSMLAFFNQYSSSGRVHLVSQPIYHAIIHLNRWLIRELNSI